MKKSCQNIWKLKKKALFLHSKTIKYKYYDLEENN